MSGPSGDPKKICQICGSTQASLLRRALVVRPYVADLVLKDIGAWDGNGWICVNDLARYRHIYVENLLMQEKGELTDLEGNVLRSLKENEILTKNPSRSSSGS